MAKLLEEYPFSFQLKVAWNEMDALGHVNNARYFSYFESARIAHFNELGVMEVLDRDGVGPILAQTQCRFKAPLFFPDDIIIGVTISKLTEDSFLHRYTLASEQQQRVVAEGEGKIVYYDYNAKCRSRIPNRLLPALQAAEKLP
jgi:acyl-CoA thioester hydrolase